MQGLSSVIITLNEEQAIRACLENIAWCREIIIVDAFSTDRTLDIAREYTHNVFQRVWRGYSEQKIFGLSKVTQDWVFFLDADEIVSTDLASEIQLLLNSERRLFDGYYVSRLSYFWGRPIKHGEWYPDMKLRLVKRGKASWNSRSVHEEIKLDGKAGYLKHEIYHYPFRSIEHQQDKFNRYSSLFAQDVCQGKQDINLSEILFYPLGRFLRGYIIKRGFLDGFSGLVIALIHSWEVFLRGIKLYELIHKCNDISKDKSTD